MTSIRHVSGSLLSASWHLIQRSQSERSQILMYHSIGGQADGDTRGLYSVQPNQFLSQMKYLNALCTRSGLRVVPFSEEVSSTVSITFDDGYSDNAINALPVLEKFEFPFHIFINPSLIQSGKEGFLTHDQIRDLSSHPLVTLGVHGYSHQPLTQLTDAEVSSELDQAKDWLADITGTVPSTLSYPHGAVNERVVNVVRKCRFSRAACSKFGPISKSSSDFLLPRIDIWSSDSSRSFVSKLRGDWDWMKWRT
jgi:peptidoglycan/xylan/chitin deacetylase (PgdA/CDA1 family)